MVLDKCGLSAYSLRVNVGLNFLSPADAFAVNAREHGVAGDGTTDVTAVLQGLLHLRAAQGGGTVLLPAGRYLCSGPLTLPVGVTLAGVAQATPRVSEVNQGSVMLITGGKGDAAETPFIEMHSNSVLRGLVFFYPEQTATNPPIPYPWTVASAGGDNMSIIDCLMINPYQAVDFGSRASGRHFIRNLSAQVLHRGIYVDRCYDVGRIENVHLWPFWTGGLEEPIAKYAFEHGQGFIFGRTDWEIVTNCFVINMSQGFRFARHSPPDISRNAADGPNDLAGNVMITGGGPDICKIGVHVEQVQAHAGISFVNCQIFGAVVVDETNTGPVRFSACGMFGSRRAYEGTAQGRLAGNGRVSFAQCHFFVIDPDNDGPALLHVLGGRVAVQNCSFANSPRAVVADIVPGREQEPGVINPVPIVLEPGVRAALITGNEFYGGPGVVNRSQGNVVIANNLEQTDEI